MKKDISISNAFDTYIRAEVVAAGLAKGTHDRYLNSKKIIVSYFGDVPIETLTAESVRDLQEHLLGWQKPDTASGNLTNLRSVVKYCRRKKLDVLDIDDIKIPKRQKRKINYLTEEEVHEFIKVVAQKQRGYAEINRLRNIAIVETLFSSGLRIGELCRLNKNSIQKRQFTVIGKSRDPRICFISNRAEKAISKYMGARNDDNPALFISNQTGKRITPCNIQRVFRFACDRSDFVNIHPHTIRHSYATHLLEKEVDIRYIADLLGHQSLDTTKIYTHYSNPKLRSIYEAAFSD